MISYSAVLAEQINIYGWIKCLWLKPDSLFFPWIVLFTFGSRVHSHIWKPRESHCPARGVMLQAGCVHSQWWAVQLEENPWTQREREAWWKTQQKETQGHSPSSPCCQCCLWGSRYLPRKQSVFCPNIASEENKNTNMKDRLTLCSLQHHLQWPRHGNDLSVHWQMNGWMKEDAVTHNEILLSPKRLKSHHLQQHGWT